MQIETIIFHLLDVFAIGTRSW